MEASSRKLIRPPLKELQEKLEASKRAATPVTATKPPLKPPTTGQSAPPQQQQQKPAAPPPEQTNAENFYFAKQIQMKTPMVVVLRDGEQIQGTVEWYDKHAFRLARPGNPSVMIYKLNIKYMFKAE